MNLPEFLFGMVLEDSPAGGEVFGGFHRCVSFRNEGSGIVYGERKNQFKSVILYLPLKKKISPLKYVVFTATDLYFNPLSRSNCRYEP